MDNTAVASAALYIANESSWSTIGLWSNGDRADDERPVPPVDGQRVVIAELDLVAGLDVREICHRVCNMNREGAVISAFQSDQELLQLYRIHSSRRRYQLAGRCLLGGRRRPARSSSPGALK